LQEAKSNLVRAGTGSRRTRSDVVIDLRHPIEFHR